MDPDTIRRDRFYGFDHTTAVIPMMKTPKHYQMTVEGPRQTKDLPVMITLFLLITRNFQSWNFKRSNTRQFLQEIENMYQELTDN